MGQAKVVGKVQMVKGRGQPTRLLEARSYLPPTHQRSLSKASISGSDPY